MDPSLVPVPRYWSPRVPKFEVSEVPKAESLYSHRAMMTFLCKKI